MRLAAAALALVALLCAAASAPAEPRSQIQRFDYVHSQALGYDLLYSIYLPPGYDTGRRRYPTLYLLHGKDGNHLEWLQSGHVRETLDRLIRAGKVAPMIVVMPDGGVDSWYVDSRAVGGPGDYATAIGHDLVAEIDRRYRTRPGWQSRGIGGLSMGGFGAYRLALQQPFRFAAAAAFSGAFWTRVSPADVPSERVARIFDGSFGRPFEIERFMAGAPIGLVDAAAKAADPPRFFITCGDQDRYKLYMDAVEMFRRMREAGLDVSMRMTGGDHDWDTWSAALPEALLFFDWVFNHPQ